MVNRFMKKTITKLQSNKGFSLSELLMALLILGLMTIGLTSGVSASLRVYEESVRHAEERTFLSTASEAVMSELRNAVNISPEGSDRDVLTNVEFTFESINYGPDVKFGLDNDRLALLKKDNSPVAYLVGSGAYSNKHIKLCDFSIPGETENEDTNKTMSYILCSQSEDGKSVFLVNLALDSGEYRHFKVTPLKENDIY